MKLTLATLSLCVVTALPAAAQPPGAGTGAGRAERPLPEPQRGPIVREKPLGARTLPVDDENAQDTVQRLQQLLQQYPPSLGRVLASDPTLLNNGDYLQPYPQLETFLAQHPDIAHNPGFYLDQQLREIGRRNYDYNDPKTQAIRALDNAFAGVAVLIGFITVVTTIAWLIRTVIAHRKWQRMAATHVDTHTKLMDRLTSNEDLITYMQSAAGRRFLEAAPIPIDGGPRTLNAPFGRIMWSVQAGIVVAFFGGGLIYASTRLASSEMFSMGELPVFVIGCAAVAVGAGFFISAVAAYGLSHRLGLFPAAGSTPTDSGNGHGPQA
jgi:hypothetical protein